MNSSERSETVEIMNLDAELEESQKISESVNSEQSDPEPFTVTMLTE